MPGYIRYADDLLLFGDSKEQLWETQRLLAARLADLQLRLHPDKTHVAPVDKGIKFLGMRVFPHTRRLSQTSLRRLRSRIRTWRWQGRNGKVNPQAIRDSLHAWLATTMHCNAHALRKTMTRSIRIRIHKTDADQKNRARLRREKDNPEEKTE